MRIRHLYSLAFLALLLLPAQAGAHTFWINLFESLVHPPGHVLTTLGWGHALPMDDMLNELNVESYELVDPGMAKTDLNVPQDATGKPSKMDSGLTLQEGDLGIRKFGLTDEAKPGTYQVVAQTAGNYYSKFLDKKDRVKWALKPMDEVKDAKKLLAGMRFKAYAKSFFSVGKWSEPKPLGLDLEVLPKTDLSDVHVGDLVEFEVLFMGKPLSTSPEQSIEFATATSNTFGGPDGFSLGCIVFNGKARFRMPTAGQWLVNVYTRQVVTPDNDLKHLAKKCSACLYASTVTFNVKP